MEWLSKGDLQPDKTFLMEDKTFNTTQTSWKLASLKFIAYKWGHIRKSDQLAGCPSRTTDTKAPPTATPSSTSLLIRSTFSTNRTTALFSAHSQSNLLHHTQKTLTPMSCFRVSMEKQPVLTMVFRHQVAKNFTKKPTK